MNPTFSLAKTGFASDNVAQKRQCTSGMRNIHRLTPIPTLTEIPTTAGQDSQMLTWAGNMAQNPPTYYDLSNNCSDVAAQGIATGLGISPGWFSAPGWITSPNSLQGDLDIYLTSQGQSGYSSAASSSGVDNFDTSNPFDESSNFGLSTGANTGNIGMTSSGAPGPAPAPAASSGNNGGGGGDDDDDDDDDDGSGC